jgi:hypothetical protein
VRARYAKSAPRASIPDARLRHLAGQIHSLGPYPLFHLLRELVDGAPLESCLEAYASFIEAHGGRDLPPPARLVGDDRPILLPAASARSRR